MATITGTAGRDTLFGTAGNDVFDGLGGDDAHFGGLGNDDYTLYDTIRSGVPFQATIFENASGGFDTIRLVALPDASIAVFNIPLEVEGFLNYTSSRRLTVYGNASNNYIATGGAGDILHGNDGDDFLDGGGVAAVSHLDGGAGNDELRGSVGDRMLGGIGNDTYTIVADAPVDVSAMVFEFANSGIDQIIANHTFTLPANVENGTISGLLRGNLYGNALHNRLTGLGGSNRLEGRDGNDFLDGGGGDDVMAGGLGNDTVVVDQAGDVAVEIAGQGIDTISSSVRSIALADFMNFENVTLTGALALSATGNGLANTLVGLTNTAANTLTGLAGNDTYVVGLGDRIVEAAGGGSDMVVSGTISLDLARYANVENLRLTGALALRATGNALANVIDGSTNTAANVLIGLGGNDTYFVGAGDVVVEALGAGSDSVYAHASHVMGANVEDGFLTGTGNLTLTGNALNNRLYGTSGADTLNGAAGADLMTGGLGNDTYVVDQAGDAVVEAVNGGFDTVHVGFTYTLGANLEGLTLSGATATTAYGNSADNVITGNAANNLLFGYSGADTIYGGLGVDALDGGEGNDRLYGEAGSDVLAGGAGFDRLDGGAGVDTLLNSVGTDLMYGGTNADIFVFDQANNAGGIAHVMDYNDAEDRIAVRAAGLTDVADISVRYATVFDPLGSSSPGYTPLVQVILVEFDGVALGALRATTVSLGQMSSGDFLIY